MKYGRGRGIKAKGGVEEKWKKRRVKKTDGRRKKRRVRMDERQKRREKYRENEKRVQGREDREKNLCVENT